jgi:phosphatidate cytidylyltransferase
MLKQRVITAVALLLILVPTLVVPNPVPLALLSLILCALGAWEWGRLNELNFTKATLLGILCSLICLASWWLQVFSFANYYFWLFCSAAWVFIGISLLRVGPQGWLKVYKPLRLIGGVWALFATWLAINQAKAMSFNFLFSVFALVWVADIGAYFFGRAFGRRKLAPNISPGKSWEGVWGGVLAVFILCGVWIYVDRLRLTGGEGEVLNSSSQGLSFFSLIASKGLLIQIFALVFMVGMSVTGDLIESLVKRSVGAKDSSRLLPGHGGVLDRIDALLPTLPIAMFWSLL